MKRAFWPIVAALCAALATPVSAADPAAAPAAGERPKSLLFRKVFAPESGVKQWPLGNVPYLPMDTKEFERLLAEAQQQGAATPAGAAAQLLEAQYTARLVGDDLLVGEAELQATSPRGKAALLPLEPCALSITQALWGGERTAALGRSSTGRLGVLVEQPGQLNLKWSLRGERSLGGEMAFALDLPACPVSHFDLELPESLAPNVDRGLIEPATPGEAGLRKWRIELGGHHQTVLRVAAAGAVHERKPLTLLRQATTYEFSSRGVDVTTQLRLDVHGAPLERLAIEIDPRLRLVAARYADRDIPWILESDAAHAGNRVLLELPEPISGNGRVIRLLALAPLVEGQSWRLPLLQVEAATWLEGTASLVVPKPLELEQIITAGCRQSKLAPLAAPLDGDSLELQCFSPDPAVDVVVSRPKEVLHVASGCVLEFSAAEILGHTIAELSLRQGERFAVRADVGPQWMIDSVDAPNHEMIDDWQLESVEGRQQQQLVVHLRKGVSARQSLRLIVTGHRPAAADSGLAVNDLEMLNFVQAQPDKKLLAVRAADGHELQLSGAEELTRLDPQQFTPEEAGLFAEPARGLVFAVNAATNRLRVAMVARKPSYTGEIDLDVVVDGKSLTETYTLRCAPAAARVDRLLVFCSHARPEPLKFSIAGLSSGQLNARKLTRDEHAALGAPVDGEVWEILLRLPRSGPFEVRAVRTTPFTAKLPLTLAALPEASSQRGTVTVRALGETGVSIENLRLKPIPAEPSQAGYYQTARGVFRYEPSRDVSSSDIAIAVSPAPTQATESSLWIWSAELNSRYALRDSTVHVATWHAQSAGRSRLQFTMPAGAELRGVLIDQTPLPDATVTGFGEQFSVELPAGKQFATVSLYYATPGQLPRLTGAVAPPWPEVDAPVLERGWVVWLPAGFALSASDLRWESPALAVPTWSQRLFGPLGRSAEGATFDPFSAADWRTLLAGSTSDLVARDVGQQVAEAFGEQQLGTAKKLTALSWGELTESVAAALAATDLELLVDAPGMEQIGLRADAAVSRQVNGLSAPEVGRDLLLRSKLELLVNQRTVVLTSSARACFYRSQLAATGDKLVSRVAAGPLADQLATAVHSGGSEVFIKFSRWGKWTTGPRTPWQAELLAGTPAWDSRGWTAYALTADREGSQPVRIVHEAAMQSLGWGVFLLIVAGSAWKGTGRLTDALLLVFMSAALALVVPAAWVPIASSATLAALCCLAYLIVDRRVPAERRFRPAARAQLATPALLLALTTLLTTLADIPALAEDVAQAPVAPAPAAPNPAAPSAPPAAAANDLPGDAPRGPGAPSTGAGGGEPLVHRVFVPVDDQQRPVGGKVYVPRELFNGLLAQAAAAGETPGDWLLTRASYSVVLSRENATRTVSISELKAVFEFQTLRNNVQVQLPLSHDGVELVPGSAKLDGRLIEVAWPAGSGPLTFTADQTGAGRLELLLDPNLQSDGTATGFELGIPRLPNSTLNVAFAGEAIPVEGPAGGQKSTVAAPAGPIEFELGPSGRLSLRWPDEKAAAVALPSIDVEELLWVKLQPGSPVLDARFKLHAVEGKLRRLRVLADSRLRLLPPTGEDSPVRAIHTTPGDPAVLDIELRAVSSETATVDLRFLVTDTSGIGNFRLPRLEASGSRLTQRLLAVSLDPALQHEEQLGDDIKTIAPADFLAAWGAADTKPQLAYSIPRGEAAWLLATRPREVRNLVEQAVTLSLGQGTLALRCEATLNTTVGHSFQLRLVGPPGLVIDEASLLEEGVQRVARWATDEAGGITLFLTGPTAGRQQVVLRGHLPVPTTGEVTVAALQWPGAELKKNRLQVYREPATLVELLPADEMVPLDAAAEGSRSELGRLIGSYTLERPQTSLKLKLAPNTPQTFGREVVRVEREGDAWTATVNYELDVRQGLVDVLRFEVPAAWTEPYRIEPAAKYELLPIPGENRRQLLVYPENPIADKYRLKIRGRLAPSLGDRLRAPNVVPRGVNQFSRYVVLPTQWDRDRVVWDTAGLIVAQPPADLQRQLPRGGQVFQVLGDRFHAQLRGIERASGAPRVRLADIQFAWRTDGTCLGTATFDLDPAGATSAVLLMPQQLQLVHLSVGGLPAGTTAAGPDGWRFALGPPHLPQRVAVVFMGALPLGNRHFDPVQLPAPSLEAFDVDRTLWTVYGPPAAGAGEPAETNSLVTPTRHEIARLEATRSVLDLAAHVASEQLPEEIVRWYAPWKSRFLASRGRIQTSAIGGSGASKARDQDLEALNRDEVQISQRLGATNPQAATSSVTLEVPGLFAEAMAPNCQPAFCLFDDSAPALAIHYPRAPRGDLGWRLTAAFGLAIGGGLLAFGPLRDGQMFVSPRLLATLAGAVWWIWLAPSAGGLILLLVALSAALVRRLRSRQFSRAATLST